MKICHNIYEFKLKLDMNILSMVKLKVLIRHLLISQYIFYWNQFTIKNFGDLTISIPYGSLIELIIDCVVILLNSYGMEQDLHTNTSTYGVWDSTSSMGVLQERSMIIYHIAVILWDMRLLKKLLSTVKQINLLLSTDPKVLVLINIIIITP